MKAIWWMAAVGAMGVLAVGCGRGTPEEHMTRAAHHGVDRALDRLNATAAQRETANARLEVLLADAKPVLQSGQKTREVVVEQLAAPQPDAQKIHAAIDAQADAMKALAHKTADAVLQFRSELTAEQQRELSERLLKFQAERKAEGR